jgi:toxin YoeB
MIKAWSSQAWDDYLKWHALDESTWDKINDLLKDIERHPFTGIGKSEPLKGGLAGCWSRRITEKHGLVYRVGSMGGEQQINIFYCRGHYK